MEARRTSAEAPRLEKAAPGSLANHLLVFACSSVGFFVFFFLVFTLLLVPISASMRLMRRAICFQAAACPFIYLQLLIRFMEVQISSSASSSLSSFLSRSKASLFLDITRTTWPLSSSSSLLSVAERRRVDLVSDVFFLFVDFAGLADSLCLWRP